MRSSDYSKMDEHELRGLLRNNREIGVSRDGKKVTLEFLDGITAMRAHHCINRLMGFDPPHLLAAKRPTGDQS